MHQSFSIFQTSNVNISATDLNLNNNPAYETQTPLQRNLAYEDTTLTTGEPEEAQVLMNPVEPTYEVIQPSTSTKKILGSQEGEDEYDKLNRELPNINKRDRGTI